MIREERTVIRSIPMRAMLMAGVLLGGTLAPASTQADDADIYDLMFPVVQGVRQRARQLSLENRRLEFDLDTYIHANTLTPSEARELRRRERVLRALSDPTVTEIRSGSTLNDLLQDAQILRSRGARVEATVWPSHVLRRVNVTAAGSPGDAGILKDGQLPWPALLRVAAFDGARREIDRLITRAVSEVSERDADAETLGGLQRALSRLDGRLTLMAREQGDRAAWSPTEYMTAKDFIRRADQAVLLLEQPNAEEQLALARDLQAGTAAELVAYMTTHGLQFAPAVSGDERAYMTAYQALADYDTRLRGKMNMELRSTEDSTRRAVGTDGYTGSSGAARAKKAKAAP